MGAVNNATPPTVYCTLHRVEVVCGVSAGCAAHPTALCWVQPGIQRYVFCAGLATSIGLEHLNTRSNNTPPVCNAVLALWMLRAVGSVQVSLAIAPVVPLTVATFALFPLPLLPPTPPLGMGFVMGTATLCAGLLLWNAQQFGRVLFGSERAVKPS